MSQHITIKLSHIYYTLSFHVAISSHNILQLISQRCEDIWVIAFFVVKKYFIALGVLGIGVFMDLHRIVVYYNIAHCLELCQIQFNRTAMHRITLHHNVLLAILCD